MNYLEIALLCFFVGFISAEGSGSSLFSCDDVTPDLCNLELSRGSLEVEGFSLTYFTYESAQKDPEKLPLLAINGGPGLDHRYLEPLKQQACRGRKVIFYDQVGTGESSVNLEEGVSLLARAPWLGDKDYYLKELHALLKHLGYAKIHVLGHSWGGMLAQMYAVEQPAELAGLILDSTLSDIQLYMSSIRKLHHSTLPPAMQHVLDEAERTGDTSSPIFSAITEHLLTLWTVRTVPMPDCILDCFTAMNVEIGEAMLGPSEAVMITGTLRDFNLTPALSSIAAPTLIIQAKYDTVTDPVIKAMRDNVPNNQFVEIPLSAHCSTIDNPKFYNDAIHEFLVKIENDLGVKEEL